MERRPNVAATRTTNMISSFRWLVWFGLLGFALVFFSGFLWLCCACTNENWLKIKSQQNRNVLHIFTQFRRLRSNCMAQCFTQWPSSQRNRKTLPAIRAFHLFISHEIGHRHSESSIEVSQLIVGTPYKLASKWRSWKYLDHFGLVCVFSGLVVAKPQKARWLQFVLKKLQLAFSSHI